MSKNNVKKAIESIASGDVRGLRKNIQEALVSKVRKALDTKEKRIAKNLIENVAKTSLTESSSDDKAILSTLKKALKSKDEFALYDDEYLARVPSKTKGEYYHISAVLVSDKIKSVWKIYDQSIGHQGPSTQTIAKTVTSGVFDTGNSSEKIKALEKVLQGVARDVAAGKYGSQKSQGGFSESVSRTALHEGDVTKGSKTSISFPSKAECVVLGSDKGFDEVTKKKVTSGLRKGSKFNAKSTDDILSALKCDKHQIQTDQLKKIKAGVKTLYVFVDPFHAYENGDRVVQVFADKNTAQEWYDESGSYDAAPDVPDYSDYH